MRKLARSVAALAVTLASLGGEPPGEAAGTLVATGGGNLCLPELGFQVHEHTFGFQLSQGAGGYEINLSYRDHHRGPQPAFQVHAVNAPAVAVAPVLPAHLIACRSGSSAPLPPPSG